MIVNNVDALKSNIKDSFSAVVDVIAEQELEGVRDKMMFNDYEEHHHIVTGTGPDNMIYDTGDLYGSMDSATNIDKGSYEAYVGTNMDYAHWVHEGGWVESRPFIKDRLDEDTENIQQLLDQAFELAIEDFI